MKLKKRQIETPFFLAVIPLVSMIAMMAITVIGFEGSPHVPLAIGSVIAAVIAWRLGYKWETIEEGAYKGIRLALPAILIIIIVGMIIASWIGGGIIATMIYYGLNIITPSLFLVTICMICGIVALAIGSSWSTMGTIGVAGMGIGMSMGISPAMVAGAVISGAYFGDKMSPLSDTTNLAAGITGTDLFAHIKHMMYTTVPGLVLALIVYFILGRQFGKGDIDGESIQGILAALNDNFVISPWLMLVPLAIIVMVMFKVPAIPALIAGVVLGFLAQVFVQGGTMGEAVNALHDGFTIASGNEMVDELFNRGGIESMMFTVSLTIFAMVFGGILEHTGMLRAFVEQILKVAKSAGSLISATIISAFFTNVTASEQYISILLPGRMYARAYQDQGLHSKNLSRALEDGGTLTSPFVPWNTCGVFILATLAVHPFAYAPYAVLNYTVPIIGIIFAFIGFKVEFLSKEEAAELEAKEQRMEKEKELADGR